MCPWPKIYTRSFHFFTFGHLIFAPPPTFSPAARIYATCWPIFRPISAHSQPNPALVEDKWSLWPDGEFKAYFSHGIVSGLEAIPSSHFTQEYGTPKKCLQKPHRATSGHASTATAARHATACHGEKPVPLTQDSTFHVPTKMIILQKAIGLAQESFQSTQYSIPEALLLSAELLSKQDVTTVVEV
ncbi:hypothetical protein C8F04DRAFT_1232723 [Mycena alexandri]|uniref:Uncharacterized protein n=1 Tax=Mycena alexandri TaxID=1745969 RepID=A0AAD6T0V9_9AGAR|nr:hypothetical protein C8F04DRAFT_1232723 [Mycena alexandri]